jgi:hypothetical protein
MEHSRDIQRLTKDWSVLGQTGRAGGALAADQADPGLELFLAPKESAGPRQVRSVQ